MLLWKSNFAEDNRVSLSNNCRKYQLDIEFHRFIIKGKKDNFEGVRPTVRVTCAGASGGTPSDEKKAEAEKTPIKRADSPASSARCVGQPFCLQAPVL
jgi:hypothetical protein